MTGTARAGLRRHHIAGIVGALAVAVAGITVLPVPGGEGDGADPDDRDQVNRGHAIYDTHCAACHGRELEGQPDWRQRKADGKLPAPPHDETGHTWHHPDRQLFTITKHGLAPIAGAAYPTDMPAFAGLLSDADIWASLAYIKSRWPMEIRDRQSRLRE